MCDFSGQTLEQQAQAQGQGDDDEHDDVVSCQQVESGSVRWKRAARSGGHSYRNQKKKQNGETKQQQNTWL